MTTTIRISRRCKEKLENLGNKSDTFDSIVMTLYYEHMFLSIQEESAVMLYDSANDDLKKTVQFIFTNVGYEIPTEYKDFEDGEIVYKEWEDDPLDWALDYARDEDFVGHNREPSLAEIAVNAFCLLEGIPAPQWNMRRVNPFSTF